MTESSTSWMDFLGGRIVLFSIGARIIEVLIYIELVTLWPKYYSFANLE